MSRYNLQSMEYCIPLAINDLATLLQTENHCGMHMCVYMFACLQDICKSKILYVECLTSCEETCQAVNIKQHAHDRARQVEPKLICN
jgi:hypothetical protein